MPKCIKNTIFHEVSKKEGLSRLKKGRKVLKAVHSELGTWINGWNEHGDRQRRREGAQCCKDT